MVLFENIAASVRVPLHLFPENFTACTLIMTLIKGRYFWEISRRGPRVGFAARAVHPSQTSAEIREKVFFISQQVSYFFDYSRRLPAGSRRYGYFSAARPNLRSDASTNAEKCESLVFGSETDASVPGCRPKFRGKKDQGKSGAEFRFRGRFEGTLLPRPCSSLLNYATRASSPARISSRCTRYVSSPFSLVAEKLSTTGCQLVFPGNRSKYFPINCSKERFPCCRDEKDTTWYEKFELLLLTLYFATETSEYIDS